MRGQAQLEAMRMRGFAPVTVDLCAFEVQPHLIGAIGGSVTLEALTMPTRAELRCVVGLDVSIHGQDAQRVHSLRDACVKAGARRVIATVFDDGPHLCDMDRMQAVEVTDTQGVLTWQR